MDDIDKSSEELGGEAQFFTDGFKQYSWSKLMDSRLSGQERLNLYTEGISKLGTHKNLPQLFRDIFKGAFLPYRDPNVLHIFLKEINGFLYDHSENLGNAFEYLLSIMGSQGDAGQFRTSRHIIDFIVEVVDPKKDETVLDPACGTAGFLISAFKHILKQHDGKDDPENKEKPLTPDEREKLMEHFVGYDISPDMVRLSLVNMYLHGFQSPKIFEYDTLGSEDRWDERYDVILANPPFMSPKGGVKPHRRFSIQANRTEVLFVDYIAEHLASEGRAGIIVPEGIIFQNGTAYKNLRKMLVEEGGLYAVISLPAGVFNPYSGVKTSILLLDKKLASQSSQILFAKIDHDGFDLGAQRKKIDTNDLPTVAEVVRRYKSSFLTGSIFVLQDGENDLASTVEKSVIASNGDYNFSESRYRVSESVVSHKWPLARLADLCELVGGGTPSKEREDFWKNGKIKWISAKHIDSSSRIIGNDLITEEAAKESSTTIIPKGSIVFVTRVSVGKIAITDDDYAINQDITGLTPKDSKILDTRYLYYVLRAKSSEIAGTAQGLGVKGVTRKDFGSFTIPVPPIDIQKQIVEEIEVKQQAINSAQELIQSLERERDVVLVDRLQKSKESSA